ncbi:MAG: hypothetical protein NVV62_04075 [Terricaulis sp.]|nr:hypothetical protein [Terricaulis sp.]
MTKREAASHILAGAAVLWPAALCTIQGLTLSPLEQALARSFCGQTQISIMGHCPACLTGAAALLLAAAMVRLAPNHAQPRR